MGTIGTSSARAGAATLAAAALLAGCAVPAMEESPVRAAAQARPAFLNPTVSGTVEARWWQRYGDAQLDELLAAALAANRDVKVALARVAQARAGADGAAGRLLPAINAVGARSAAGTGYDAATRQRLPDTDVTRVGLDVSWEIDLFGAVRSARDAAVQVSLATAHAHRGAQLAVLADVARQYFTLRGAQARLAIVQALVHSQEETLRLTELKRRGGEASDFDVDRARAALADTQALAPQLQSLAQVTLYRLATLTGRLPGAWDEALATPPSTPDAPLRRPAIAAGQPAELLQRRPDLMAADALWRAAGHRHAEAQANRFPRLLLGALFGRQWTDWNALDLGAARFANVGATLALPLYAGGRIQAGIDAASAGERAALAAYEHSVLQALEDVESTLVALRNEQARAAALDAAVASRESALRRARALYRAGQADLLVVLDVERGLLAARLARAAHQTDELLAEVQLFKALGGGWQEPAPVVPAVDAIAATVQEESDEGR